MIKYCNTIKFKLNNNGETKWNICLCENKSYSKCHLYVYWSAYSTSWPVGLAGSVDRIEVMLLRK